MQLKLGINGNEKPISKGDFMFEGIRKVLDDFETTFNKLNINLLEATTEEENVLLYLNMHLAEALMQESYVGSDKVAKIILASNGLLNDIKVKVE